MRPLTLISGLALTLVAACNDSVAPPDSGELTANVRGDTLLIHNHSSQPAHYAPSDNGDPSRILWQICAGPGCIGLAAGADTTLLLSATGVLQPGAQVVFLHWWHAVPDGTGRFRPDSIRTIRLEL